MTRVQSIENALVQINDAVFQELCDSFLIRQNSSYKLFSRTGSQRGKLKTVKGTPDTFILLSNGKYLFVEYSTNISAGTSKLKDDIKKCIDEDRTEVSCKQIAEIILCVNFKIRTKEIEELRILLKNTCIVLTLYTLDALALELSLHHSDLVCSYLGIPVNTGQVVSIDHFIKENNSRTNCISTPLDNTFLHREQELIQLKGAIGVDDFIVLTGAAGVGKTKLALEAIKEYVCENESYNAYCIAYKHHPLLEDLNQQLDTNKNYILFVDDANRIDAFSQIIGCYSNFISGKLKIIITVRDYAYLQIKNLCYNYNIKRIDVEKLTDGQITDIIKGKPFEILNDKYRSRIIEIASGNPRLAIMASLLAKRKKEIAVLSDVSILFENYFSTFILDKDEFSNDQHLKHLGVIAFFDTIPYKDRETTEEILDKFDLNYYHFIDTIDEFDRLEIVEVQFEYVKIIEQNLSTFFFYLAFIKKELLSFDILLDCYYKSDRYRFKDCIIPTHNIFGNQNVMERLKPSFKRYLTEYAIDREDKLEFLSDFWFYLQIEALEFVYNVEIKESPITISRKELSVKYDSNDFIYSKNKVLGLLANFYRSQKKMKDALELTFEYVKRFPSSFPELIYNIKAHLSFTSDDVLNSYARQFIFIDLLVSGIKKDDRVTSTLFVETVMAFLSTKYVETNKVNNNTFSILSCNVPPNLKIQDLRIKIWQGLNVYFKAYPNDVSKVLNEYLCLLADVSNEIIEFDLGFLIPALSEYLNPDQLEHCKFIQSLFRRLKRSGITNFELNSIQKKFRTDKYQMYLNLDWKIHRELEKTEKYSYSNFEKVNEANVRKSYVLKNSIEVDNFWQNYIEVIDSSDLNISFCKSLDYIVDENFKINNAIGLLLLEKIIKSNNEIGYIPVAIYKNHLNSKEKSSLFWSLIESNTFKNSSSWKLSYFEYLSESLVNLNHVEPLLRAVLEIDYSRYINLNLFEKFIHLDPELIPKIIELIVKKNESQDIKLKIWDDSFLNLFVHENLNIELLEKAYLNQDKIQSHFDYEGDVFLRMLREDISFLQKYISEAYNHRGVIGFGISKDDLSYIWQVKNIEDYLGEVFNFVSERYLHIGVEDNLCNLFFKNIQDNFKERARNFLLNYCRDWYSDSKKMNSVIDIVRNSMVELFEEILLLHVSLIQDVQLFSEIWWVANGGIFSGETIIGDIEAAKWRNILSIVMKSDVGAELIPIKRYIYDRIDSSLRSGDEERRRRFLSR